MMNETITEMYYIAPETAQFQLSCESTADLPFEVIRQSGISVIFYSYLLDGESYYDDMGRNHQQRRDFY